VQLIRGNYKPAGCDILANKLSIKLFGLGHKLNLVGNRTCSRCF
jgi:hypothetical protein